MRYDRRVIAYHATPASVADRLLDGEPFEPSNEPWEWLGTGMYFWEYGHQRAHDWGQKKAAADGVAYAVLGAVIQLGACLDLLDTDATDRLHRFALSPSAVNPPAPNSGGRNTRDCWLVNSYCSYSAAAGTTFHTVRAPFLEGGKVMDGSSLLRQSHIQICVREHAAILGVFRPTRGVVTQPNVAHGSA